MASEVLPDASEATLPRILIVDDEFEIRITLRMVLEDDGYEVLEAEDGSAALELMSSSPTPLVVVLDLLMPQMSGEQMLSRASVDPFLMTRHAYLGITAKPIRPALMDPEFVTLLSTYDIPMLAKPFDLDEMLAMVASLWRRLVPDQEVQREG